MLLLACSLAHAQTDIGTTKKFGLGVGSGPAAVVVTGKYYLSPSTGLAFAAGTSIFSHSAQVAFQSNITSWGDKWSWGQLPLYWHADLVAGLDVYPGYTSAARVGVGGGVGIALQFKKVPFEVYGGVGLGVFPVHGYCSQNAAVLESATGIDTSGICWVGGLGDAGVRWYF